MLDQLLVALSLAQGGIRRDVILFNTAEVTDNRLPFFEADRSVFFSQAVAHALLVPRRFGRFNEFLIGGLWLRWHHEHLLAHPDITEI